MIDKDCRFLTPPQVAKILGVSKEHVVKYIDTGELQAMNTSLGDRPRWKVNPIDLESFVKSRMNVNSNQERKDKQ